MSDHEKLVKRLRAHRIMRDYGNGNVGDEPDEDCEEAARTIESLLAEKARAREEGYAEALEEIADYAAAMGEKHGRRSGTDYQQGSCDQAARIELHCRALRAKEKDPSHG